MPKPRSKKSAGNAGDEPQRRTTSLGPGETRSAVTGEIFDNEGKAKGRSRERADDDETPS